MYAGKGHSNTKYIIKYSVLAFSVWETHSADKSWLNHTTYNNYHWFTHPKYCLHVSNYFKDGIPKSTCQSQNAFCGPHSDF